MASILNEETFLRSINIVYDADAPEHIGHYFPTSKGCSLIEQMLGLTGDRAFLVVAPYGSGKSLAASFAMHMVENTGHEAISTVHSRLKGVNNGLFSWFQERKENDENSFGLAINLYGFQTDLIRSISSAALDSLNRSFPECESPEEIKALRGAKFTSIQELLSTIKALVQKAGMDSVVVIWDEFGRHLEGMVAEGRSAELDQIQSLAEFVARQKAIPYTLSLFLHQGLLNYASSLPQTTRREWKKIEGRFLTIDFIEDSKEVYRLIGEIAKTKRHSKGPTQKQMASVAKKLKRAKRFPDLSEKVLAKLLASACPIEPYALELLPKISARVSQNERTLFSFLFQADFSSPITASAIYDYFSDQMQADIEVGGTHRRWIETESAISKLDPEDKTGIKALKTTCLLGLGLSGERSKASQQDVVSALSGYGDAKQARSVVKRLVTANLLLHRKHADELAIWHGTDMDLRGRLQERRGAMEAGFDLTTFLANEIQPPVWLPLEYNAEYGITRYFESFFFSVRDFADHFDFSAPESMQLAPHLDGRILYLVTQTAEDFEAATQHLSKLIKSMPVEEAMRLVVALPKERLPIREAAIEVACLREMERDSELTSQDPLALPEVRQMLDDAQLNLHSLLERLTIPDENSGVHWFINGQEVSIPAPKMLSRILSGIMKMVFPKTPKFKNDMIVRKKPSGTVVNSRKKLILGILERHGQEVFGITGNFPDASMARTIFVGSGIYRESSGTWGYAAPNELEDPVIGELWETIRRFFTDPAEHGKSPSDLFDNLAAPPYGIRPALFPILFAAGFKAHAHMTSLLKDGAYVPDILPTTIEAICKEPDRHSVQVLSLDKKSKEYLELLRADFSGQVVARADEADLIGTSYEAIMAWSRQLPPAVATTRRLSKPSLAFRNATQRTQDPVKLMLEDFPRVASLSISDLVAQELGTLSSIKNEIENVVNAYRIEACGIVAQSLKLREGESLLDACKKWSECYTPLLEKTHPSRPVLVRMRNPYDNESRLIDSIADALLQKTITRWEDADLKRFSLAFQDLASTVEAKLMSADLSDGRMEPALKEGLLAILKTRLEKDLQAFAELAGYDEVERLLDIVVKKNG